MKNLMYILLFIRCTQVAASEAVIENENRGENSLDKPDSYELVVYELVLTTGGGMLKCSNLEGLISPNWNEMDIPKLIHWGSQLLKLLNEPSVKITKAQRDQIIQLERILQNRRNQLQEDMPFYHFIIGSAEETNRECESNLEKIQSCLASNMKEIAPFFAEKKQKVPEGIPTDVYDDLDDVMSSLEELQTTRVAGRASCLAEVTHYRQYIEEQKREKAEKDKSLADATTLLIALQKFIMSHNKK